MIQVRQYYNGKFQALRLVDAHEPYTVDRRRGLGDGGFSRLQQPPQLADKGKDSSVTPAFKSLRMAAKCNQILPPLRAAVHRAENAQEVEGIVDVPYQPVHAHIPCRLPQLLQSA